MSMYSQLLASALDIDQPSDEEPTTGSALSDLLRCRDQLGGSRWPHHKAEGSYVALINNLAYDAALIKLARHLGVECGAEEYDLPAKARARLENVLSSRGVPLDEIESPTRSS